MPTIQNVSTIGDLDVPLLRRVVKAGETVDVSAEHAALLLDQSSIWAPVTTAPALAVAKTKGAPA